MVAKDQPLGRVLARREPEVLALTAAGGHRGGEAVERLAKPPDLADGGLAALATAAEWTRHK
eukprot:416642-Alexandrium_andersonii.AAC.1